MSTQKDTKTPNAKGEKSGNITAYSKSKLSGKPICRKTIKPIKQQLKVNGKTLKESLLDLPRFTLYFILHGKVIQQYLDLFAINSGCAPLTVDDVRKVIADNRLGEQIDIEKYDKYDIANKGCNIDDPFVIEYDSGYVPIEHCMMEYILGPFCHERYERQKLFEQEGRFYDILDFKPLNGNGVSETYYFDITKGFRREIDTKKNRTDVLLNFDLGRLGCCFFRISFLKTWKSCGQCVYTFRFCCLCGRLASSVLSRRTPYVFFRLQIIIL